MTAAIAAAISSMDIALSLPRLPLKFFTATDQVRVASAADGSVRLLLSLGLIGTIQMPPEKRSSHGTIGTTNLVGQTFKGIGTDDHSELGLLR